MSIRIVFDCMVFLQAITNESGPAFACFRLVDEGRLTLFASEAILDEVHDVLDRPRLRRKFATLTDDRVSQFLAIVRQKAVMFEDVPHVVELPRDPNDEPYLDLAIAADARYLVSRDNDLLDLMADPTFLERYPNLAIVDPPTLLRELNP